MSVVVPVCGPCAACGDTTPQNACCSGGVPVPCASATPGSALEEGCQRFPYVPVRGVPGPETFIELSVAASLRLDESFQCPATVPSFPPINRTITTADVTLSYTHRVTAKRDAAASDRCSFFGGPPFAAQSDSASKGAGVVGNVLPFTRDNGEVVHEIDADASGTITEVDTAAVGCQDTAYAVDRVTVVQGALGGGNSEGVLRWELQERVFAYDGAGFSIVASADTPQGRREVDIVLGSMNFGPPNATTGDPVVFDPIGVDFFGVGGITSFAQSVSFSGLGTAGPSMTVTAAGSSGDGAFPNKQWTLNATATITCGNFDGCAGSGGGGGGGGGGGMARSMRGMGGVGGADVVAVARAAELNGDAPAGTADMVASFDRPCDRRDFLIDVIGADACARALRETGIAPHTKGPGR